MTASSWKLLDGYLTNVAIEAGVPNGDYSDLSFRFVKRDGLIVKVDVGGNASIVPKKEEKEE